MTWNTTGRLVRDHLSYPGGRGLSPAVKSSSRDQPLFLSVSCNTQCCFLPGFHKCLLKRKDIKEPLSKYEFMLCRGFILALSPLSPKSSKFKSQANPAQACHYQALCGYLEEALVASCAIFIRLQLSVLTDLVSFLESAGMAPPCPASSII